MKSNLSAADFKKKLMKNTKHGTVLSNVSPFAVFTFMDEYDKPFLGTFSDTGFNITKNNIFQPPVYRIEGTYKELNEKECIVEYSIKAIRWLNFLNVVGLIFIIAFVLFMGIFFIIIKAGLLGVMIFLGMISLMVILPVYIQKYNKRSMENTFKNIFKIAG